jgi:hypothetical protein
MRQIVYTDISFHSQGVECVEAAEDGVKDKRKRRKKRQNMNFPNGNHNKLRRKGKGKRIIVRGRKSHPICHKTSRALLPFLSLAGGPLSNRL